MLSAPTIRKAAEESGIPERTIYDWLKVPKFKATFRDAQRESFKVAVAQCQKYLPHSVQTLVQIMTDKTAPHSARVSAAGMMMKFGRESIELDDVVERVERLEQATEPNNASDKDGSTP